MKSKYHGKIQVRAVRECRYSWCWKEVERRLEWGIWMLRKQKQLFMRVPCPWAVCLRRQVGLVESPKCSQQNSHQEVNIPAAPGQVSLFVPPVSYSTRIWLSQMFQSPSPSISSSEPCSLSSLLGSHAVRGSARVLFCDLTQAMTLLSGIGQALPFRSTL